MILIFKNLTPLLLITFLGCQSTQEKYRYKLPLLKKVQEKLIQPNVKLAPGDLFSQMALADYFFADYKLNGNQLSLSKSQELSEQILIKNKNYMPALLILAKTNEDRHHFADAIAHAMNVYSKNPKHKEALSTLVTANLALGKIQEAVTFADQLAALYPRTGVLAMRGLAYLSQGREEEGVFELEHAIALEDLGEEKDSSWARCILGRHLMNKNMMKDAEFLFQEGVRIVKDSPFCLDMLGQLHAINGDFEKSSSSFEKAFSSSRQIAHLRHQAELNDFIGKKQLALDQWMQVEKLVTQEMDQGRMDHNMELAKVLIRRHLPGDGLKATKLIVEELRVRQNPQTYYLLALSEYGNKNLPGAIAAAIASLQTGEKKRETFELLMTLYREKKNEKKAMFYEALIKSGDSKKKPLFL